MSYDKTESHKFFSASMNTLCSDNKPDSDAFNWDNVKDSILLGAGTGAAFGFSVGLIVSLTAAAVVGPLALFGVAAGVGIGASAGALLGLLIGVIAELWRSDFNIGNEPTLNEYSSYNAL